MDDKIRICDGYIPQDGDSTMDIIHDHWHNPGPNCNDKCKFYCQGCRQPIKPPENKVNKLDD